MARKRHKASGFTIIELLVVIGIIALLTGLLAPGLSVLTRSARGLKQKSILHSYETGLELFRKDFDYYPPSTLENNAFGSGRKVTGAQHLAEALMGRDLEGFDPRTRWCDPTEDSSVYSVGEASVNRRKPHYTVVKDDGVYSLEDVYEGGTINDIFSPRVSSGRRAPVMTDIFGSKRVTLASGEQVKVGTPVLYFRADTATRRFMGVESMANHRQWIYNYEDNRAIIDLGAISDQTARHGYDQGQITNRDGRNLNGLELFYERIRHPQFRVLDESGNVRSDRPYNPTTFILISAGWDGIFGTKDDVTNISY